jgi:hypothetical protein
VWPKYLTVVISVARSKQVYIEWLEATVLLTIYLSSDLILIDAKNILSARSFS